MRLGIKMLNSSSTLNNLMYSNQSQITPGESATIMFQLIDLDQGTAQCPMRYIPSNVATLSAKLNSINSSKVLTKIPSNPFAEDKSIWSFNLSTTETQSAGGVNLEITMTDGASIKIAIAQSAVIFNPRSPYQC